MRPYAELDRRGQVGRLASAVKRRLREAGTGEASLRVLSHQHNTAFDLRVGSERWFLRVGRQRDRTREQLEEELEFVRRAAAHGVPCPGAVVLPGLPAIWPLEGDAIAEPRWVCAFEFAPGRGVHRPSRPQIRELARAIALLQEVDTRGLGETRWQVDGFVVGSGEDADSGAKEVETALGAEARRICEAIFDRYLALRPSLGPAGLIHGDLHPWNCHFGPEGIRVFDFDDCGVAPLGYDLLVPIRELREIGLGDTLPDFLAAYAEIRPLPPGIPEHIELMEQARAAQLIAWVCTERANPGFDWWEKWSRGRLSEIEAFLDRN